jgi:putative DNA primase/helicase
MTHQAIEGALLLENAARCDPPLPETEVRKIAASVWRYPDAPTIGTDPGLVKRLADQIVLTEHFAQDEGEKLYRFSDGVYKPDGGPHIRRLVKMLLEQWNLTNKWTSSRSEEVVQYIRVDSPALWERPPLTVLNLRNGLLDLETGQLVEHSAQHLSCVQLPIAYDPAARCIEWDSFVELVFPKDAQELAFQIPAWLMRPDVSLQKAVLLLGEGNNGKSTYLAAMAAFLGKRNVSAVSLHKLESDRFATVRLLGKLANICPDLPSAHLVGTSTFKAVTGGDSMLAEYKFRDSFEFVPFARLLFSANHVPQSGDSSAAFFRRWLVVPFSRTFEGGEAIPRPEIDARLSRSEELSGVLNRALQALRQLQEQGGPIESNSMAEARQEFRQVTDPLAVWLDRSTIEQSAALVTKSALLSAYNLAAAREGKPSMTSTGFGIALRRLRPKLEDAQRTVAGKLEWVWLGLGLRLPED